MSLSAILRMLVLLVLVCTVVVQSKRTAEDAMAKDPQKQSKKKLATIYLQSETRTLKIKRKQGDILQSCKVYNKRVKGTKTEKFETSPIDEEQMDTYIGLCKEAKKNSRYEPEDRKKRFIIAPGTLWCGAGNSAPDNETFGTAEATDRCCHAHDLCTPYIGAFEYDNFNMSLYNFAIWSKHQCSTCNLDFYNCLKDADTTTADLVGSTFFNILDIGCFDFVHPEVCSAEFWGICTEWTRDPEQDKEWELLNNPYTY